MKSKRLWTGIFASIGMLILILDGKTALAGAQQGVELCLKTVIPSLFPFFLLSILLTSSFLGMELPWLRPLGKLLRIPSGTESILLSAFLGGYPVGAQTITQAFQAGYLPKQDAERMLSFCNNAGPAFLFGMVASMFSQAWAPWLLWGIHILSAILVSFLIPGNCQKNLMPKGEELSISAAMTASLKVMAAVCGWVILFRVVITFLSRWFLWLLPTPTQVALTGLLELSNGCCELLAIESISIRFLVCSGILSFGGLCVTMQTVSVTKGLSLHFYFMGKALQTLFSLLLTAAVIFRLWYMLMALAVFFLIIPRKMQKRSGNLQAAGV